MPADEVVELYLTHVGIPDAPLRALSGFGRVHLDRGQKQTISFTLAERQLSIVDEAGARRILPGDVDVWVGGGQPGSRRPSAGAQIRFTITGERTLPD